MGAYAEIGHLNVITGLELLELQEKAVMLGQNRISALPLSCEKHFRHNPDRFPALVMEVHASITGKHYFDCNDTIRIGAYATIAGLGSSFFTHGIDLGGNRQETAPVVIGKYTMIGARCVVVKGSILPDYSILGANSTLHKAYDASYMLYSGVPAIPVKKLDGESAYFHRKEGFVD